MHLSPPVHVTYYAKLSPGYCQFLFLVITTNILNEPIELSLTRRLKSKLEMYASFVFINGTLDVLKNHLL